MKSDLPEFILRNLNTCPSDRALNIILVHNQNLMNELRCNEDELECAKTKRLHYECQYVSLKNIFDEKKKQYEANRKIYNTVFNTLEEYNSRIKADRRDMLRYCAEYQNETFQVRNTIDKTLNMDEELVYQEIARTQNEKTVLLRDADRVQELLTAERENVFTCDLDENETVINNVKNLLKRDPEIKDITESISSLETELKFIDENINRINRLPLQN